MKKNLVYFLLLITLPSCQSCKHFYFKTIDLHLLEPKCQCRLFIENYHTITGTATYLTDSTSFRIFTGSYDEEQGNISFDCTGDSIIVEESIRDPNYVYGKFITKERKIYLLKYLKSTHVFQ
jgi:hypothetical protein